MCGIIGRFGEGDALPVLLTGLKNLEYRGYDSAGVAVRNGTGVEVVKREGELDRLQSAVAESAPNGPVGIGHTRWSTHGPPTDENAHPHTDCGREVAVVHNGIIENYAELKEELSARGHEFTSETDTEVVPHVFETYRDEGLDHETAFRRTVDDLDGSFAVALVAADREAIFVARRGSPLVLGVGDGEVFFASDVPAFLEYTEEVVYLDDGDVATLSADGFSITDVDGDPVDRPVETVNWVAEDAQRKGYDHYMLKEIYEQPEALDQAVRGRAEDDVPVLEEFPPGAFSEVSHVHLLACGTSYHAAMYARQLLLDRGVPASVHPAGEYATNPAPVEDDALVVAVTQSGETADTLESMRHAAAQGARTLALTNVVGSTAAREADEALFIRAGPEIGVAATKTFSSQVATLLLLVERVAADVGRRADGLASKLRALERLPEDVQTVLDRSTSADIADRYADQDAYFFIGRGTVYPVALEGALKFKEITYEHAEGFSAGELKHGPLALVTPDTPVFAVFSGRHDDKTLNNVKEVQARGAPVIGVTSTAAGGVVDCVDEVLTVPETHPDLAGVLANVQLQLVSYHVADLMGRAIDKPRNLAKSVTVE